MGANWGESDPSVMNETGSYPGQPWLWLYQMWYHGAGALGVGGAALEKVDDRKEHA